MKRIAVTGGTGRLGSLIVDELRKRGDEVTVLSRSSGDARWDPMAGPAPAEALAGRDAVVHLAGEYLLQRWNDDALRRIRESREIGTRNLVAGMREAEPRPAALISAAATGYYGDRPDPIDEDAPPGDDVLAEVCKAWEREAANAEELGVRVVRVRTGVVLDRQAARSRPCSCRSGSASAARWPAESNRCPGSTSRTSSASTSPRSTTTAGTARSTPPLRTRCRTASSPRRSAARSTGRRSCRCPRFALKILYGGMSKLVLEGQNAVPRRTLELGYRHRHPDLDEALRSALRDT